MHDICRGLDMPTGRKILFESGQARDTDEFNVYLMVKVGPFGLLLRIWMLAWFVVPEWAFMKTRNPRLTAAFARKIETLKKLRCKPQGFGVFRWSSMGIYAESISP